MKKFIFFLLLIIIAGSAVLFFGWVRIPENKAGVFFSSITGYEKKLLTSGSFHWRWQKLIPRSSSLYLADAALHKASIRLSGNLPSADIYSAIMPGNPSFSYSAEISAEYKFSENEIIDMVINGEVEDIEEGINKKYRDQDTIFESLVKSHIDGFFISLNKESIAGLQSASLLDNERIMEIFSGRSDGLEIIDINLMSSNFPDFDLYVNAKEQYAQLVLKREELLREEEIKSARNSAAIDSRLQTLEKYGQLLTKYPILLDYLKNNPDHDILKDGEKLLQE